MTTSVSVLFVLGLVALEASAIDDYFPRPNSTETDVVIPVNCWRFMNSNPMPVLIYAFVCVTCTGGGNAVFTAVAMRE